MLRSRSSQTVRYQRYPSLFASETLDFDSASETERAVLQRLKEVMDELATADSLFMGVTAHKGRKGRKRTEKKPSDPAKKTQKSAAPALRKAVESAAPFSLEPAGRRYEAEAGEISGGASARAISEASGKSVVGNMHAEGAACAVTVDGAAGGTFQLTIGYATAKNVACVLTLNGVEQRLQLPATGGWNTLGAVKLSVQLKPGKNKMKITSQGGMKLDYFDFRAR